jgi:hypothetical protein
MKSWYHISEQDFGSRVTFFPRLPKRPAPGEDMTIPRICVAERIANCLRLIAWTDYVDEFFVYQLINDESEVGLDTASPKTKVPDYGKTPLHTEAWLTKPAEFRRVGRIKMWRPGLVMMRPCWWWIHKEFSLGEEQHFLQMTNEQRRKHVELEYETIKTIMEESK